MRPIIISRIQLMAGKKTEFPKKRLVVTMTGAAVKHEKVCRRRIRRLRTDRCRDYRPKQLRLIQEGFVPERRA